MSANDAISPAAVFKKIGPPLAGVPFPVNFSPDASDTPKAKGFIEAYTAKHGGAPDLYSAQGYTAIWLIAQGLKSLPGKPTREALAEALNKITVLDHDVYGGLPITNGQAETRCSWPGRPRARSFPGSRDQDRGAGGSAFRPADLMIRWNCFSPNS